MTTNEAMRERDYAIKEASRISRTDDYFAARPQVDFISNRRQYESGHDAGWDSAITHSKASHADEIVKYDAALTQNNIVIIGLHEEVRKLKEEIAASYTERDSLITQQAARIEQLEGMVAVKGEALKALHEFVIAELSQQYVRALYYEGTPAWTQVGEAISATAETAQAFRDKLTEPLRREVAQLVDACESSEYFLELCFMETCPARIKIANALSDDTQATAHAYEQEVEQRGAVKALEDLQEQQGMYDWLWRRCRIIFFPNHDDSLGTYPIEHNPHANKDGRMFIEGKMAAELRATSKKG